MKTLKTLIKEYKNIFETLGFTINPNFKEEFLHIKKMETNATKISYIKKDKIEGLKKNVKDFILKPDCPEQRDKYFTGEKPSKFLSRLVTDDNSSLYARLSEKFNRDFIGNIKYQLTFFEGRDNNRGTSIGEAYMNNGDVAGCMAASPKNWFEVYENTENLRLASLIDENGKILIRALLWHDINTNHYWLDKSYELRIINGDEKLRQHYQIKLLDNVIHSLMDSKDRARANDLGFKFGCAFINSLKTLENKGYAKRNKQIEELESGYNIEILSEIQTEKQYEDENHPEVIAKASDNPNAKIETKLSKKRITIKPKVIDLGLNHFPYSDTFLSISKHTNFWSLEENEGDSDYICCRSQEGEDVNDNLHMCDACGETCDEDYISYSEVEGEELCDECSTFIEERSDRCRTENAIYNNYSGEYHYSYDLD